jgi:DMSO/TMAO reductase YedYZ molybdopterin-dependent catalytic subunit
MDSEPASSPRQHDQAPPGAEAAGADRNIGRRAFLGMVLVGIGALFLGRDLFAWLSKGLTSSQGSKGTEGFRINSVAEAPQFDSATWRLTVDGLFRRPLTLDYSQLTDLPSAERLRDFYCVEGWGVTDVTWKGITLSELMERADIDPAATHLIFHSSDGVGYTDSLTLEEARRPDTLLAYELNGEPLTHDMGRPLRLVLPGTYGYKYVKWVERVEAVALAPGEEHYGYWERYGYPIDATIR